MTRLPAALALLLTACATPPVPPDSCAVDLQGTEAQRHYAHRHCERLGYSAHGVTVERSWAPPCDGSRACLHLREGGDVIIHLDQSEDWPRLLHHELTHLYLLREHPEMDPEDHHEWMLRHRECGRVEWCVWSPTPVLKEM